MRFTGLLISLAAALCLCGLVGSHTVCAEERIENFHSEIVINPDSTMTVTETITVNSERNKIKRGIYRDFPTEYRTASGRRYVTSFDVLTVKRDGLPELHHMARIKNGRRLYIGNKDIIIPSGEHVYEITYNTDRQVGIFDTHDELYWNVTGNGWAFPIVRASATVHPPTGAAVDRVTAYTGVQGARGGDYEERINDDGSATFTTTKRLEMYNGLTVVAGWPKGFVTEPDGLTRLSYAWRDVRHMVIALFCIAVILIYYLVAWIKVGRDPLRGHVVVQYDPPDGLSPAAMRYIIKRRYDPRAFTAAIINLAVKGLIEIKQSEAEGYELVRTGLDEKTADALPPGEKKVFKRLFGRIRKRVKLGEYKKYIGRANTDLKEKLNKEYSRKYFLRNIEYILPGVALSILAVAWCSREFSFLGEDRLVPELGALFLAPASVFLGRAFNTGWSNFLGGKNIRNFILAAQVSVFFIASVGANIFLWVYLFSSEPVSSALVFALIAVNVGFYLVMDAPTVSGRMVMDRIEGFRVFLKATEEDRLNMLNPPERTPELFESMLPYAIALDCENEWAEQFKDAVMQSAIAEKTATWYHGTGRLYGESFTGSLTGSITSSLGGAISSSTTAPGSSSGFSGGGGGGGSSGGGGGGGGGGGW